MFPTQHPAWFNLSNAEFVDVKNSILELCFANKYPNNIEILASLADYYSHKGEIDKAISIVNSQKNKEKSLDYLKTLTKQLNNREELVDMLNIEIDSLSIKATTTEKMGFIGRGEGIAVHSIATIEYIKWQIRLHLLFQGTMPITENLPNEWFDTPNLHMCTIKDFVNFCNKKNIKINSSNLNYKNLFSELGIFVIEK